MSRAEAISACGLLSAGCGAWMWLAVGPALAADADLPARDLDCLMEAHVTAKLSAPVAGLIERIYVDRGDVVRAGDVVAELESEVERAAVDLAQTRAENDALINSNRSRLEFLRRKLGRQQTLRSTNVVTDAAVDEVMTDSRVAEMSTVDAEYNRDIARQELKRARAMLRQRRINSPVNGVVVERHLSPGEYRSEQSQILTVAQLDPLNIEVFMPLAYFGQTAPGATALIMPEAPVGGEYVATVKVVDPVVDSASGTFGVRLELPNPGNRLPAGLRCRARFQEYKPAAVPERKATR